MAATEFQAMSTIYAVTAKERLCPKPYDFLIDSGAFACEYVDAPSLHKEIAAGRIQAEELLVQLKATGRCVRKIHDGTFQEVRPLNIQKRMEQIAFAVSDLPTPNLATRFLRVLQESADKVPALAINVGRLHGDCKPANFLWTENGIITIDAQMRHTNYVLLDLVNFLNDLAFLSYAPRARSIRKLGERSEAAFLDGYGWPPDGPHAVQLAWFRLASLLTMWPSRSQSHPLKRGAFAAMRAHSTQRACNALRRHLKLI